MRGILKYIRLVPSKSVNVIKDEDLSTTCNSGFSSDIKDKWRNANPI